MYINYIYLGNAFLSCYVTSYWHDHKRRMYNSNLMDRIYDKFREGVEDVEEMLRTDKEYPERRLRSVMDDLANGCGTYIRKLIDS